MMFSTLIFYDHKICSTLIIIILSGLLSGWRMSSRGDPVPFDFTEPKEERKGSSSMSFGWDSDFHPCLCTDLLQFCVSQR
jgi:hypothetical protein